MPVHEKFNLGGNFNTETERMYHSIIGRTDVERCMWGLHETPRRVPRAHVGDREAGTADWRCAPEGGPKHESPPPAAGKGTCEERHVWGAVST
jgi:hypothetical protein